MAMRNYGAMLDAKLMQSIAELRTERGDAYLRVTHKYEDGKRGPEANVGANLRVALEVAQGRGLGTSPDVTPGVRWQDRIGATPAPPPEPEVELCRGCAGTGVDITAPTRLLDIAEGPWNIGPKPGAKRLTSAHVGLGIGVNALPLTLLVDRFAKALAEGREVTHVHFGALPFPLGSEHACTWCHGTGVPQLSTHTIAEKVT